MRLASWHALLPFLLCSVGVQASQAGKAFLAAHMRFVQRVQSDIKALRPTDSVLIADVGANNGWWTDHHTKRFWNATRPSGSAVDARPTRWDVLFEPNAVFSKGLRSIARRHGGEHIAMAAWTHNTTLLFRQKGTQGNMGSVIDTQESGGGRTVQAIDFGAWLRAATLNAQLVVVKCDIEGSEYHVLPPLLASGTLCAVHYLLVEWHLDGVVGAAERCCAQTLRNTFEDTLRRRCASPPRLVLHEENYGNKLRKAPLCSPPEKQMSGGRRWLPASHNT
jgi:FkbM family methyltransferase